MKREKKLGMPDVDVFGGLRGWRRQAFSFWDFANKSIFF
jgi:hypothetical protein